MIRSYFRIGAYDAEMSYLRQTRRKRSRSFVQGFLKLMFVCLEDATTSLSFTDIFGNNRTFSQTTRHVHTLLCTGPGRAGAGMTMEGGEATQSQFGEWAGVSSQGIIVGTGTTAVAPTDYQLATAVADGTSSGTLEYFPCGGTNFATAGSTASFDIERLFRNSSGGTITINEVGIYGAQTGVNAGTDSQNYCCLVRDIVSPGFAVANGEYLRVVYTISVTT